MRLGERLCDRLGERLGERLGKCLWVRWPKSDVFWPKALAGSGAQVVFFQIIWEKTSTYAQSLCKRKHDISFKSTTYDESGRAT